MSGDYVSRDYLLGEYDRQHQDPPGGARKIIAEAPAADVVEVARCRECKHHDGIRCFRWNSVIVTRFGDYCSSGERKDGGQDE